MSLFENYDTVSESYDDAGRLPVCVDKIIEKIKPGCHLLDAGCGTGNYLVPLLKSGKVAKYTAFDASQGMLDKLRKKAENWKTEKQDGPEINAIQASLLEPLPFSDGEFDIIIHNQVMHHITTNEGPDKFVHTKKYLAEFHRVLKSGGVLAINNCTSLQHTTIWWVKHMPTSKKYFDKTGVEDEELKEMLSALNFSDITFEVDRAPLLGDVYFQYEKFLSVKYQKADSGWTQGTPQEKKDLLETISRNAKDIRLYEAFDKEVRDDLATIGQTTEVFAVKV